MKKIATSILALIAGTASVFAQVAATGNDGSFGYSWATMSGSSFEWVDIKSVGTEIPGLGDDGNTASIDIGFDLPFYFSTVTNFHIGSNGFISFGKGFNIASNANPAFSTFPTTDSYDNIVCPFLSDLNFTQDLGATNLNPAKVYYYTNNVDSLVVTYDSVAYWDNATGDGWSGNNTFQIIFNKNDESITFNYLNMDGSWNASYNGNAGAAQIGIESVNSIFGLQIHSCSQPSDIPMDSLTIRITAPLTYNFDDVSSAYNSNINNRGVIASYNGSKELTLGVSNIGTNDISSSFDVVMEVRAIENSSTEFYAATSTVTSILSNEIKEVSFATPYKPSLDEDGGGDAAEAGKSYFLVSTNDYAGQNSDNDKAVSEIALADDSDPTQVVLTYADMGYAADGTVQEDIYGFEGGAVFIEPPYYPVTIIASEFVFITNDGAAANTNYPIKMRIWDNSGAGGSPGIMIVDQIIPASSIITTGITQVFLDTPFDVTSGGYYVGVVMEDFGANDFNLRLGMNNATDDSDQPFSNNNYEILSGTFGSFRSNDVSDLMISSTIDATAAGVGIKEEVKNVKIGEVYPNPTSGLTSINYTVENASAASFTVKNLIGQNVKNVNIGNISAGNQTITFDASDLEAGIYFYTLNLNEKSYTKKFIVK